MTAQTHLEGALRILTVEDDVTVLRLYQTVLTQAGHTVVPAQSGQEALKQITGGKFDLIFLDLKLPDIQGMDLLAKIRHAQQWTPVVIVTANPTVESSIEAIKSGAVLEYIIKPFRSEELLICIQRTLEKAELTLQNKRLINKLEKTNQALMLRVQEFEAFAHTAADYDKKIADLNLRIKTLEKKLKEAGVQP